MRTSKLKGFLVSSRVASTVSRRWTINNPKSLSLPLLPICLSNSVFITKRYKTTIDDTSWAVDELEANGEKIPKAPDQPYIVVDDKVLQTPSQKVLDLVNQVLCLNVVEVQQLLQTLQKRLGITDEELYARTGFNRTGEHFPDVEARRAAYFGGGAAPASSSGGAPPAAEKKAEPVVEKTAFDIKLKSVDAKAKIKVIKEVRTITGLGLKEAKELVEKAPVTIKQGLKKDEVENFKKILTEAGAEVEIL